MDKINDTTYSFKFIEDEAEVGDITKETFEPHVKLTRWDRECSLEVFLDEVGQFDSATKDEVKWRNGNKEVKFYPLAPTEQFEFGGFEFEIVLLSKPATNVITLRIASQGLSFFYQPPLTDVYTDGWNDELQDIITVTETEVVGPRYVEPHVQRPAEAVGSYAVYHSTKRDNSYKCGKAFHILRPMIEDADGKWAWGELHIGGGLLTVTIPQTFLDTAKYPVRHAAGLTFGFTEQGFSNVNFSNSIHTTYTSYSPSVDGIAESMTTYCKNDGDTFVLGLYNYDTDEFIVATEEGIALSSGQPRVVNFSGSPPVYAAVNYHLVFRSLTTALLLYFDDTNLDFRYHNVIEADPWPDPVSWSDSSTDRTYMVYVTYSPLSGEDIVKVIDETLNATESQPIFRRSKRMIIGKDPKRVWLA